MSDYPPDWPGFPPSQNMLLPHPCSVHQPGGPIGLNCQLPLLHQGRHVHETRPDDSYRRTVVRTWPNLLEQPLEEYPDAPYLEPAP